VDVDTLPNHLKSFVSCLLLSCSFIFLHLYFRFMISNMVSEPGEGKLAVAHRHLFVARVGLDVLPPHVRGRVGSPTLPGY
jgi:hypothetical protein